MKFLGNLDHATGTHDSIFVVIKIPVWVRNFFKDSLSLDSSNIEGVLVFVEVIISPSAQVFFHFKK